MSVGIQQYVVLCLRLQKGWADFSESPQGCDVLAAQGLQCESPLNLVTREGKSYIILAFGLPIT